MKTVFRICAAVLGFIVVLGTIPAYMIFAELRKAASEDPKVWADDVAELAQHTRERGELEDSVVFIGSSSIRFWNTLDRDMQPIVTIRHGFGGAKLADIEYYAKDLVNDFSPRAVVVFAGTNDLSPGNAKPPAVLRDTYRRFVSKVRADLPEADIYFIGITPTVLRWAVWDTIRDTNQLIREFSKKHSELHYIETGPLLLGFDGQPLSANYRFDGLHLSERGYEIWTDVIRARLMSDLSPKSSR